MPKVDVALIFFISTENSTPSPPLEIEIEQLSIVGLRRQYYTMRIVIVQAARVHTHQFSNCERRSTRRHPRRHTIAIHTTEGETSSP
jgi:hypothetical protein